jgi:hypothetical protein
MRIVRHCPEDEHLKVCPDCRRRMEFMQRVGTEAHIIAGELEMSAAEAIRTLITLAHNISRQNDRIDDFIAHVVLSLDMISEGQKGRHLN